MAMPTPMPITQKSDRFAEQRPNDVTLGRADGFQNADVPRPLDHGGVHRKQDHQEADGDGERDHALMKASRPGRFDAVIKERKSFSGRTFVPGKKGRISSITACGVVRARALDEENRGFVARAGKILQRGEGHEQARALAVLHDSGDVKIVVQQAEGAVHG